MLTEFAKTAESVNIDRFFAILSVILSTKIPFSLFSVNMAINTWPSTAEVRFRRRIQRFYLKQIYHAGQQSQGGDDIAGDAAGGAFLIFMIVYQNRYGEDQRARGKKEKGFVVQHHSESFPAVETKTQIDDRIDEVSQLKGIQFGAFFFFGIFVFVES